MKHKKTETLQRLLEEAAEMFLAQGFEHVSVATIAKAAHCSTATVYEIYGSKEGLFAEAISKALERGRIDWDPEKSGFAALLRYAQERLIELASPRVNRLVRAVVMQPELTRSAYSAAATDNNRQNETAVKTLMNAAIAEGMLRQCDLQILWDHFRAMTSECILVGLLNGQAQQLNPSEVVHSIFWPLVTEAGKQMLQQYLEQDGQSDQPPTG